MKSIIILLIITALCFQLFALNSSVNKKLKRIKKLKQKQSPIMVRQVQPSILPHPPQGMSLKNHFGAKPDKSPYGPQPTLSIKRYQLKNKNGTITEEKRVSEILHLANGEKIQDCKIKNSPFYQICFDHSDCNLCAANPQCGWCGSTQRCLPGALSEAYCPDACFHAWIFNYQFCDNSQTVITGNMTNVAYEAERMINPDITKPKVKVETTITKPEVVHTPVQLGDTITEQVVSQVNQTDGTIIGQQNIMIKKPILGEVHQVMNIDTYHQQYVDLESGKRLDSDPNKDSKLHGID